MADRVDFVARLALNFARLRRTPNAEKRVAILFGNYPTKNARIGNGVGLDTPASVMNLLRALNDAGYDVDDIPTDGDALMHQLIDRCTNDEEFLTDDQLRNAVGHVSLATYDAWFNELPAEPRRAMVDAVGRAARRRSAGSTTGWRSPAWSSATSSSASSPPAASAPTRWRSTTAPTCRRRTTTSPITAGFATSSAPMP